MHELMAIFFEHVAARAWESGFGFAWESAGGVDDCTVAAVAEAIWRKTGHYDTKELVPGHSGRCEILEDSRASCRENV